MKTITNYKWTFILITFGFLIPSQMAAQWDFIEFHDIEEVSVRNTCLDNADNVYAFMADVGFTRTLKKFNGQGVPVWNKPVSGLINFSYYRQGGMEYYNQLIYTVGVQGSNGVIIETGLNMNDPVTTWELLSGSAINEILDIEIKGGFMYIVGRFGQYDLPSTLSFSGGLATISAPVASTFVAKYDMGSGQVIWAKVVENVAGENIDVDAQGSVFISGRFSGTATFYTNGFPIAFFSNGSGADTFLAKFDNQGEFDTFFGLKTASLNASQQSHAIEVSDVNNHVYWGESNNVIAYNKDNNGAYLWTRNFPPNSSIYSLAINNCGDLYVTGSSFVPVANNSNTPCGGSFFGASLSPNSGASIWNSNATSCISSGVEVLIDSNNKEVFVGNYNEGGNPQVLTIDTFPSATPNGYFIGVYDDFYITGCVPILGVENSAKKNTVIYPNPSFAKVTISLVETEMKGIEIYDTSGRLVFSQEFSPASNEQTVDVSKLSSGTYIVRVLDMNFKVFTTKLVKG